ncbi:GDSL-type esterase/lipase family protein [Paenibacillus sp. YN15]|uniref:GDSL-type esterase/lipase family protein n=1 Tax=Paenibacillus sp. YN15 TaxID=1742774 RepID=UPI000DCCA305|nr:GDSL-type esterase/lipase family protein [Paenibacillus sp. YN15]RAU93566.1 hypothetical protein DQG13_25440 [Paenibacillus sp. YN15]
MSSQPSISTQTQTSLTLRFNFESADKLGFIHVPYHGAPPIYNEERGWGFVRQTCAVPPRPVQWEEITADSSGFYAAVREFEAPAGLEQEHYNRFGMAFRVRIPPGAYEIEVVTATPLEITDVSISGLHPGRILEGGHWDAAGLIPVRHPASVSPSAREWRYHYVNGRNIVDIEIEPKQPGAAVGVKEIRITSLLLQERPADVLPAVYTLGDSTVKSYTFEEAPLCGWGQVFDDLFELERVRVINYSMGGRSLKNSYWEGRFNDLLLSAYPGDYLLLQSGHNDERQDELHRFGRGNTEASYEEYLREVHLPAIRSRGVIPVLITPVSRVNGQAQPGHVFADSFQTRRFPALMKQAALAEGVTLLDLNARSVDYYNEIGAEATIALFMSLEAGETPGKTNDGSFANGHPSNKIDGTHYKEALARQLARMVAEELAEMGARGDRTAAAIAAFLKPEVKAAIAGHHWAPLFPQMAADTTTGRGAYYRNQIEKLLQLGVLEKDADNRFRPYEPMDTETFAKALYRLLGLAPLPTAEWPAGPLTRERMGILLAKAYHAAFTSKPAYMTDYNGATLLPGMPGYDPNLSSGAQGVRYDPLVPWEQLKDTEQVDAALEPELKEAYGLGLIRSEYGLVRGRMANGDLLEPKLAVSREKAAKALYFMWVLAHPVKQENDVGYL